MSFEMQFFLFSSLFFVISSLLFLKPHFSSSKSNKNLPPSPPKLPFIGNFHQLGSGMHRVLQTLAQTYGPLMLLHFGTVPVLIASSVDAAKEITKTHDIIFSNRPFMSIASRIFYDSKNIAFAQYGEYWRQAKSISVLHLLNNKRVQSYQQVREDEVVHMIERIQGANESLVNLSELIVSLTNNVICKVALGRSYEGEEANYRNLLHQIADLVTRFSFRSYIPWLGWGDRVSGLHWKADKLFKKVDEFFEGAIDEHENKKQEVGGKGQDLVDVLLEIQKDQSIGFRIERYMIKAILMDLFNAGTDTIHTSIVWAIGELLQNPRVMKQLQKEAKEVGQGRAMIRENDLEKMHYLKAVVKESLRLHVPVPLLIPRESTKDVKLLGYDIPSGTQVMINAWAIARDPSIWEEPEEFRPERFLNSFIDYKGIHAEFIPFGAGRRMCPGIGFATVIEELVLANLAYKFKFELPDENGLDMSESGSLSVHKKSPIFVLATPYV